MSDRYTIAENDRFRLNSDRGIEWKPGTHGDATPSDVAFLLIDAALRLSHRLDAIESGRRIDNSWRGIRELSVRMKAIVKRVKRLEREPKQVYVLDPVTTPRVVPIAPSHPGAGYDDEGRHIHSHALAKGKKIGRDERARDIVEFLDSLGDAQMFYSKPTPTWEGHKFSSVAELVKLRFLMDDDRR